MLCLCHSDLPSVNKNNASVGNLGSFSTTHYSADVGRRNSLDGNCETETASIIISFGAHPLLFLIPLVL